jgi:hypothetical protein
MVVAKLPAKRRDMHLGAVALGRIQDPCQIILMS